MSNPVITLYHANWSLCSQMVRVALFEKGLAFKEKHIRLCDQYAEGENLDNDFLKINPHGTVPAVQIDESIICGSEEIISQLDKIEYSAGSSLYPKHINSVELKKWVADTTITDGVKFASTLGTIIPVFSSPLIQFMVKKLPFKSILKILIKHPKKDRKMVFIAMYFGNPAKSFINLGIKKYASELLNLEKVFADKREFFYGDFTHVDINLMCIFHRLVDLKLESSILTDNTPNLASYWKVLQHRNSYKKGILDYYGEKEQNTVREFYQDKESPFIEKIIKEINFQATNHD